jgi:hypothetical protein
MGINDLVVSTIFTLKQLQSSLTAIQRALSYLTYTNKKEKSTSLTQIQLGNCTHN